MSQEYENAEIETLNFEELDVEELEKRLETAALGGFTPDAWCVVDCALDSPSDSSPGPICPSDFCGGGSSCGGFP